MISVLQTAYSQKATKEHFLLPDGTLDKTSYQQAKWFNLFTEEVTSFDDLVSLLERLESDHQKDKFVIRGVSADGVIATQKVRRKTFDPLSQASPNEHPFKEAEHNWLMIDLDHIALPPGMSIVIL